MLCRFAQLILIMGIVSCASVERSAEIAPYIPEGITSVTFKFGNMQIASSAAECFILDFNPNVVVINREEWNKISGKQRRWVIQHELGHCLYGVTDHDNSVDVNGCPTSIMFWHIPENKCIRDK